MSVIRSAWLMISLSFFGVVSLSYAQAYKEHLIVPNCILDKLKDKFNVLVQNNKFSLILDDRHFIS